MSSPRAAWSSSVCSAVRNDPNRMKNRGSDPTESPELGRRAALQSRRVKIWVVLLLHHFGFIQKIIIVRFFINQFTVSIKHTNVWLYRPCHDVDDTHPPNLTTAIWVSRRRRSARGASSPKTRPASLLHFRAHSLTHSLSDGLGGESMITHSLPSIPFYHRAPPFLSITPRFLSLHGSARHQS